MDRDAIARERRCAEARDALEFERDRESALLDQIGDTVLDAERERIDREALARLDDTEAALVREILIGEDDEDDEEGDQFEDEWDEPFIDLEGSGEEEQSLGEEEIARLLDEVEVSRARQAALQRFIEALSDDNGGSARRQETV